MPGLGVLKCIQSRQGLRPLLETVCDKLKRVPIVSNAVTFRAAPGLLLKGQSLFGVYGTEVPSSLRTNDVFSQPVPVGQKCLAGNLLVIHD